MAPTTDHLVGLLLGAEEDWPTTSRRSHGGWGDHAPTAAGTR